jgi:hypothetical protein
MLTKRKGFLTDVRQALLGFAEIKPLEHIIDCDANPVIPSGLTIEKHVKGGTLRWVKEQVLLHLSKKQEKGGVIGGHDLRKELENEKVMNACVLDYLEKNQHLIPESWKGKAVFFWGTIYRDANGSLYVRFLCWGVDRFVSRYCYLDFDWSEGNPAAVSSK